MLKTQLVRIALVAAVLASVAGKYSPLGLSDGGLRFL